MSKHKRVHPHYAILAQGSELFGASLVGYRLALLPSIPPPRVHIGQLGSSAMAGRARADRG
eukprot:12848359-Alexandrium_andersonii.AAC.2